MRTKNNLSEIITRNRSLTLILFASVFLLQISMSIKAQTDHGGADVTWENETVSGVHTNIGTLNINGAVTVSSLSRLVVTAATINVNGGLSAFAAGYTENDVSLGDGIDGGNNHGSGGGGYGGMGGNGNTYAVGGTNWGIPDITIEMDFPNEFGSAGGPGGGAIRLTATGLMTINGTISANGKDGLNYSDDGQAGGAGGSIWLDCGTLAGAGTVSAAGGDAQSTTSRGQGGGGGGRIAIYYGGTEDFNLTTNVIAGINDANVVTSAASGTCHVESRSPAGTVILVL